VVGTDKHTRHVSALQDLGGHTQLPFLRYWLDAAALKVSIWVYWETYRARTLANRMFCVAFFRYLDDNNLQNALPATWSALVNLLEL
jgi:hypothetical protein